MIKEDYVNFKISKLLRDKGFDESCDQKYDDEGYLSFNHVGYINAENPSEYFSALAPTHQMVMKWLREVHNIFISIVPSEVAIGVMNYTYVLYKIDIKNSHFINLSIQGKGNNANKISYGEAVEAAIEYVLENVI